MPDPSGAAPRGDRRARSAERSSTATSVIIGVLACGVLAVTALGFVGAPGRTSAAAHPAATVTAAPVTGLTARVVDAQPVAGGTRGTGLGASAIRFSVRVQNTSKTEVDLDRVVVHAVAGPDSEPCVLVLDRTRAFPRRLEAGASVTGRYVFVVPPAQRDQVTVTVDPGSGDALLAFTGPVPIG